jgi:hypothetical protein
MFSGLGTLNMLLTYSYFKSTVGLLGVFLDVAFMNIFRHFCWMYTEE